MKTERIIIVAGPRRGKSTLAAQLSGDKFEPQPRPRVPIFCGDPLSTVKEPLPDVTYLPEGLPFSGDDGAAQWVADNWFSMPGPWICEGHVMARALRRWIGTCPPLQTEMRKGKTGYEVVPTKHQFPADRIIVLDRPGFGMPSKGQDAMHRGVMTVWRDIAHWFEPITEYL